MISEKVNRSEILAEMKHLMRERSNDELNDVEAEKIAQNATEFFRMLLQWDENFSVDRGVSNGQ